MKRTAIRLTVILLLCSLLSGCGQKDVPVRGLPMPQGNSLLKTDNGYFFSNRTMEGGLCLYHLAADALKPEPVCKESSCDHNNSNCTAYIKTHDTDLFVYSSVGYFRDRLYFLECPGDGMVAVVSMNPVTWERTQEMTIDPRAAYAEKPEGVDVSGCFSENTLVLMYSELSQTKNDGDLRCRTEVIDLTTNQSRYLFSEHFDRYVDDQYMHYSGNPYVVDNKLYLSESGLGEMPGSSKILAEKRFSQLDLDTGEVRQLIQKQYISSWTVENNTLYYADFDSSMFMELNLYTGETQGFPIGKEVDSGFCWREGDHIYLYGYEHDSIEDMQQPDFVAMMRTYAYFYDREYQLLGEFHSCDGTTVDFTTQEGVYFRNHDRTQYYYLSWADIESGKTELTEVRQ